MYGLWEEEEERSGVKNAMFKVEELKRGGEKMFKFKLGEKVKDTITGYEGIVMARTEYWTGCNRYGVLSPKLTKDNKPAAWEWFDEPLLTGNFKGAKKRPGGAFPNPPSS